MDSWHLGKASRHMQYRHTLSRWTLRSLYRLCLCASLRILMCSSHIAVWSHRCNQARASRRLCSHRTREIACFAQTTQAALTQASCIQESIKEDIKSHRLALISTVKGDIPELSQSEVSYNKVLSKAHESTLVAVFKH